METNLYQSYLIFICAYSFTAGFDNSVILPTVWYYIKALDQTENFYAAVLAAQCLGFVIALPIFSKLTDRLRMMSKLVLLLAITVKIVSNIVYALPLSGFCPLVGLFFSGAANGVFGMLYGQIVRFTKSKYRSKLFILVDSLFTLGTSIGSGLGGVFTFHTNILGLKINDGNSPAIILLFIWFVALIVLSFLPSKFGDKEISRKDCFPEENDEKRSLIESLDFTVLCLLYLIFTNSTVVATCTGILELISMELFHLKLLHVKLLFAVGMAFVLVVNIIFYNASTYYNEKTLLIFTIILQIPAILLLCTYAAFWRDAPFSLSYTLIIFACFAFPQVCFAVVSSLLSKITPTHHANTIQSIAMLDTFLAALVGRGLSGIVFKKTSLIICSCSYFLFWFLGFIWFGLKHSHLAVS